MRSNLDIVQLYNLLCQDQKRYFGAVKTVCERARKVLGATHERPSHLEVQFMWTKRRMKHCKLSAMLTTKFAGGSYLNKVELQNGRLALGHSSIYITPTTYGTNFANGKLGEAKLHQNFNQCLHQPN